MVGRNFLAAGAALALAAPAGAGADPCAANGLLPWAAWVASVEQMNPGIFHFELPAPHRDRLLGAYPCEDRGVGCPPDRVEVFYCTGNSMVLFAYEKSGCAIRAEQVPLETYRAVLGGAVLCRNGGETTDRALLPE
ncbi:hypothetical protein [Actibacterium sp. MT2.3-13A]|uniref:hypothetical protein n=1 Tax=Actibacterium sp. MT2.3-13A TaxID=2828332 RepID=UPI001BAA6F7E|nr:hypothetical protein [Actibacterium sp. MT2.3-13A]